MEKIIISIVITSCIALSISSAQADSPDLRGQGSLINKPITSIGSKPGAAEISLTRGMGIPPPSITKEAPAISNKMSDIAIGGTDMGSSKQSSEIDIGTSTSAIGTGGPDIGTSTPAIGTGVPAIGTSTPGMGSGVPDIRADTPGINTGIRGTSSAEVPPSGLSGFD